MALCLVPREGEKKKTTEKNIDLLSSNLCGGGGIRMDVFYYSAAATAAAHWSLMGHQLGCQAITHTLTL